jgi:hypothetical protein
MTYLIKIEEIDIIKNDLKNYRDQVVGGTLFSSYEERMKKNDKISERYSRISIWCFAISASIMLLLLFASFFNVNINYMMPFSISIISFTAAFFCSAKSKVYHKSGEEYAHKATLLKSFVGYREQYKQTLDDEEYNMFFKEVIEAVKINPSDKIDKLLHFKWP